MIVIVSAAITKDGYMDDRSPVRLVISGKEDWREVHALRAECDAILVGADTLRKDDPSLVIRDVALRRQREADGKPADIIKIAVSGSGELDPSLRFFTEGRGRKIVITRTDADAGAVAKYSPPAEVIRLPEITAGAITGCLTEAGIGRLMVEGGAKILKMFLEEDMTDRLRLAISPLTLEEAGGLADKHVRGGEETCCTGVMAEKHDKDGHGAGNPADRYDDGGLPGRHGAGSLPDTCGTRLPYFGRLPFGESAVKRKHMAGAMEVTDYIIHPKADTGDPPKTDTKNSLKADTGDPSKTDTKNSLKAGTGDFPKVNPKDLELLHRAIDLSRLCTPSMTAYSVGCVIAAADGQTFEGYTHESGPHNHAEEEAILKAEAAGADLAGATIYTSMEPCSTRKSKPVSCCELILRHKMGRVVYACAEPGHFVRCASDGILRDAGIEVTVPEGFAGQVAEINSHII